MIPEEFSGRQAEIDRSFVRDIGRNASDGATVEAIIRMAGAWHAHRGRRRGYAGATGLPARARLQCDAGLSAAGIGVGSEHDRRNCFAGLRAQADDEIEVTVGGPAFDRARAPEAQVREQHIGRAQVALRLGQRAGDINVPASVERGTFSRVFIERVGVVLRLQSRVGQATPQIRLDLPGANAMLGLPLLAP